jgi:hypothetical protein
MFHLKPTRFALPSRAKEENLGQGANFLGEVGVRGGPQEVEVVLLRTFEFGDILIPHSSYPGNGAELFAPAFIQMPLI